MNYGTATRLSPDQALEMAELFFGPRGLGLDVAARRPESLEAAGPQGSVSVRVQCTDGSTEVFLKTDATDALDEQVRRFMAEIYEEAYLR